MSIICLICKDKLLNNAPGSQLGSLNSLVENQVVATGCGHLYHAECLQCWFRTQVKKLQNQGVTGVVPDHCPTCQTEVSEEQIRRVHLLEDHRDAMEKARCLERMENLEIYCHQLEINIQRLQRENDLLLNKALSPSNSSLGKGFSDDFAAIVKNDRVMWLKKDGSPLAGVVLSIFKKDGSLWVKLKMDKKIRPNQRSGLFGSFRFDKRQEMTVPFQEIMLEKDFKNNNVIDENSATSEPATPTLFAPLQKAPSFRSSTLSLPGEYIGNPYPYSPVMRTGGLHPIFSYDQLNNYGSNMELSSRATKVQSEIYSGQSNNSRTVDVHSSLVNMSPSIETGNTDSENFSEHRDYVVLNQRPSPAPKNKINDEGRATPQDGNGKRVTFADDLKSANTSQPLSNQSSQKNINHFRDHDYKNLMKMSVLENLQMHKIITESAKEQIDITTTPNPTEETEPVETTSKVADAPENLEKLSEIPSINLIEASSTPCSSSLSIPGEIQTDNFIEPFQQLVNPTGQEKGYNSSCFDITFTALFYKCDAFDRVLLLRNSSNDQIQQSVQQLLANGFVNPLRNSVTPKYALGYSDQLYETIAHLCSSYLDLEELMTILFEYVFKIPPFICYSYDMCDYIHQFFIDFTDKHKIPSVQQLFEKSLVLQDNLKLRMEPSPALILQMPSSEDGIIHYDAVLPSLTLNISHVLERGEGLEAVASQQLTCYCNKTATLECARCAEMHGKSPVLFCEDCSILLEAIHDQMYHRLELSPIKSGGIAPVHLDLAAVICLKSERYSAFIRSTSNDEDQSSEWVFIDEFNEGQPKVEKLPNMEKWIKSITSADASTLNLDEMGRLNYRLLTECRMFLYTPKRNSYA